MLGKDQNQNNERVQYNNSMLTQQKQGENQKKESNIQSIDNRDYFDSQECILIFEEFDEIILQREDKEKIKGYIVELRNGRETQLNETKIPEIKFQGIRYELLDLFAQKCQIQEVKRLFFKALEDFRSNSGPTNTNEETLNNQILYNLLIEYGQRLEFQVNQELDQDINKVIYEQKQNNMVSKSQANLIRERFLKEKVQTIVAALQERDNPQIKNSDINRALSANQIKKILYQIIGNSNDIAHVIVDDSEKGTILSKDIIEEEEASIECIQKIRNFLNKEGRELKIPIIIISQKSNGGKITTVTILPKNYKTIGGQQMVNQQEVFYFFDTLTGSRDILESKKVKRSILKSYLINGGSSSSGNIIDPIFKSGFEEVPQNKVISQSTNENDSGWWSIYNILMMIYQGKDTFLEQFNKDDLESIKRMKTILSLHVEIQSDKVPLARRDISHEIEQFIYIDTEIKKELICHEQKTVQRIKELQKGSATEIQARLIQEEKELSLQIQNLKQKIMDLVKILKKGESLLSETIDETNLESKLNRFISQETKRCIEKKLEEKSKKLQQQRLKHNEVERNRFIEEEIKNLEQISLTNLEKRKKKSDENSKYQMEVSALEIQIQSSQSNISQSEKQQIQLNSEQIEQKQNLELLQEKLRDINSINANQVQDQLIDKLLQLKIKQDQTKRLINLKTKIQLNSIDIVRKEQSLKNSAINRQDFLKKKRDQEISIQIKKSEISQLQQKQQYQQKIMNDENHCQQNGQPILLLTFNIYPNGYEKWAHAQNLRNQAANKIQVKQKELEKDYQILNQQREDIQNLMTQQDNLERELKACKEQKELNTQELIKIKDDLLIKISNQMKYINKSLNDRQLKQAIQSQQITNENLHIEGNRKQINEIQSFISKNQTIIQIFDKKLLDCNQKIKELKLHLQTKYSSSPISSFFQNFIYYMNLIYQKINFFKGKEQQDMNTSLLSTNSLNGGIDLKSLKLQLEEGSKIQIKQKEELKKLEEQLNKIQNQIKEMQTDKSNYEAIILENVEKENISHLAYKTKMKILLEVNIERVNLNIYGHFKISEIKLDNLINCLLNTIQGNLRRYSIWNPHSRDNVLQEQQYKEWIEELKNQLFIRNGQEITQSLVDQLTNKIKEQFKININNGTDKRYVLVQNTKELNCDIVAQGKVILYEEELNYVALIPIENQISTQMTSQKIINTLLKVEILEELCNAKYQQKAGRGVRELDIEELYLTYKSLEKEVEGKECYEYFIDHISKIETQKIENRIIFQEVERLRALYSYAQESTKDLISIKEDLTVLKDRYKERLWLIIQEEGERRKKEIRKNIQYHSSSNSTQLIIIKEEEIKKLEVEIEEKEIELDEKNKEIMQANAQLLLIKEAEQNEEKIEINCIKKLQLDLENYKKALKSAETLGDSQKNNAIKIKQEIKVIENKQLEIESNKELLLGRERDIKEKLKQIINDRDEIQIQIVGYQTQKEQREAEKRELEEKGYGIKAWANFLENIYNSFIEEEDLFRNRKDIKKRMDDANTLIEKYQILIGEQKLKRFADKIISIEALKNDCTRRESLEICLKRIFSNLVLTNQISQSGTKAIEVEGINIIYEEVEILLKEKIEKEINKSKLSIDGDQLRIKDEDIYFGQFLNGDYKMTDEMYALIDKKIKTSFIIEEKNILESGKLSSETVLNGLLCKGQLKKQKVSQLLQEMAISYQEVLRCFVDSIKLISGNNIYIKSPKIQLQGINFALVAKSNIFLPKGFELNVAGLNGAAFCEQAKQAYGEKGSASKLKAGRSGEDGFDGFCGSNGGHIYISAEREIFNLEFIKRIETSGGKGAEGQKGGTGQKGGKGDDTADAEAEDFGYCIFNPGFACAFARIPGLDPTTGEFSINSEKSGNGGNAGRAGFGGEGGYEGEILIKDIHQWIKYKVGEEVQFSENLKKKLSKDIIVHNRGDNGDNAETIDVKGGEAGDPGAYGCDQVIYVKSVTSDRQFIKGDYSNYLLEPSIGRDGSIYNDIKKCKPKGIQEDPELYAFRSPSYTALSLVTFASQAIVLGFVAAPIIASASVIIPVVGFTGWAAGMLVSGKMATLTAAALAGGAFHRAYSTFRGLDVVDGVPQEKQMKNRYQIKFNNRYCDYPPLRNEEETRKYPRTDQRSRGKEGEDSKKKEEKERDEHGKSKESSNEFDNNFEITKLNNLATNASKDIEKDEQMKSLQKEQLNNAEAMRIYETQLEQIQEQANKASQDISQLNNQLKIQDQEKKKIQDSIEALQNILIRNERKLHLNETKLMDSMDQYIQQFSNQLNEQIKIEFAEIKINSKHELIQQLKIIAKNIFSELQQKKLSLQIKQEEIKTVRDSKKREILEKELEIDRLKQESLQIMENKLINQKYMEEINEAQIKLKEERLERKKKETVEEIQFRKDYDEKKIKQNANCEDLQISNIKIEKRQMCRDLNKKFLLKDPRSNNLPSLINLEKIILKENCNSFGRDIILGKLEFVIEINIKDSKFIQQLTENPKQLDDFYRKSTIEYFQECKNLEKEGKDSIITIDNFIALCGLEVHYEIFDESKESKRKQAPIFTELERQMLAFFIKGDFNLRGEENIYKIRSLLQLYKENVKVISELEYPAINVLTGNIDRFYQHMIQFINNRVSDDKKDSNWPYINQIIGIIEQISKDINEINLIKLWKSANIVQRSKELLENLFINDLNNMKILISELNDSLKKFGKHKKEIIVRILQPSLLKILVKKESVREYENIKQEIFGAKINSSEEKEDKLYEILSRSNQFQKSIGLSEKGFIQKYNLNAAGNVNQKVSFYSILDLIAEKVEPNQTS